ncbi:MAG TPA: hypothetical protein VK130_10185 [Steroidobacteraceae bacterium]|nr:hypothetical protein [Steroidobacteraceae bacterium]
MRIPVAMSFALAGFLWCRGLPAAPGAMQDGPAVRAVYLDRAGVIRWRDNREEVALYGANYCIMSGSDYRMAGLVGGDRKAMIDEDMAQFARMGWTALRLCSWGDWENADRAGNLIVNEHVDLLDYLISRARERGIYILLTPIHTYNPAWADELDQPTQNVGFSRYFERSEMGTNAASIAAQANYIRQLLQHVNPYTGVAIKDEPAVLFVEMINEPVHHPEDRPGSIRYINTLVNAVRDAGAHQLTFFNVSQDFAIAPAIRDSRVDGVSFGWYPTSLVAGRTLQGNFLPAVDGYPDMLRPDLAGRPRLVYEFDQADLLSGYLYPAMVRSFRSVGAQLATMFAYDMLQTAPYNLGWQTHFLNLVHTPRKAVSAVIAAEAMRRLPRMKSYGHYPDNLSFGDFRVSYEGDMSELNAADAFMYAGDTADAARDLASLKRIVGFGSSGSVDYEGTGAYFLDRLRAGVWRLELYPDEVLVRDPFEQPQPGKFVSRLLYRSWPMTLRLPDLGDTFIATPLNVPGARAAAARAAPHGVVAVEPGVWLLTRRREDAMGDLPARAGRVGLREYHVNAPVSYPDFVQSLAAPEFMAGAPVKIRVRVASDALPDEVRLWVRAAGAGFSAKPIAMQRARGNDYVAVLPPETVAPGLYEYAVSTQSGDRVTSFPGGVPRQPFQWPFHLDTIWSFRVTPAGTPMRLFNPRLDYNRLSFVRPGEQYRNPFFRLSPGETADETALTLDLPDLGPDTPERYAAALYIGDVMAVRKAEFAHADALHVTLKAHGGSHKTLQLTLIEKDGTAWMAPLAAGEIWTNLTVPLERLRLARSIHIPSPYPGLWNYWREAAQGRGGPGDHVHLEDVERLQLTVTPNAGTTAADDARGAAVESVTLSFARGG